MQAASQEDELRVSDTQAKREKLSVLNLAANDILDAVPIAMLLAERHSGAVYDLNKAFSGHFGYSRSDCVGKPLSELGIWHERVARDTVQSWLHAEAFPQTMLTRVQTAACSDGWVRCTVTAITLYEQPYLLLTFEDMTELVEEQAALQRALLQERTRLGELQQLVQVGFWEYNLKSGKIWWSPIIFKWFGLSPEAGTPSYEEFLSLHTPESAKRLKEAVERALQTGAPYRLELEAIVAGEPFHYIGAGEVECDASGKPIRLFGTVQNITERKKLEKSLKESKALLEAIIDTAAIGICVTDEEGKFVLVNPAYCHTYGYSEEELLGKHFSLVIPDEEKLKASNIHSAFIAGDPHSSGEWRLVHKDGRLLDIYVKAGLLIREDGRRFKVTKVEDITERKRAAKRLREAEEALLQSQKMEAVGTLASGIAHDFNNLLGGILGNVKLLYRRVNLSDERVHTPLRRIEEAANRAAKLTAQLLGFARKGKYQSAPFSSKQALLRVLDIFAATIDRRIRIKTQFAPHLPPITGDQNQIEQVFLNILVNAADAVMLTLKEKKTGEIRVSAELCTLTEAESRKLELLPDRKYVRISISDTGTGIPEEVLPRIFDPFFTTKEVGKGTGLGLAMVYGIMKNHEGAVAVETEEGVGTTFHLYFPTDLSREEKYTSPTVYEFQPSMKATKKKYKVLVIEDEEMLREMLAEMLTEVGIEAVFGIDGEDGLAQYRAHQGEIDLILLDMNMPNMSGEAVYNELRQYPNLPPVVVVTGYASDDMLESLQEKGVQKVVLKPYDVEQLTKDVLALLEEHSVK